jgi:putative ABC transport system permease protein
MQQPPWIAERLLTGALRNPRERDMVLGDLHEEWLARHSSGEPAAWWYWRTAIAIALHALFRPAPTNHPSVSGDSIMLTLLMEAKFAIRGLLKRPALTAVVTLTLALGLGANSAVFNMIDVLILRPYPLPDVDRMVLVAETGPGIEYRRGAVSPANFIDWREHSASLRSLTAMQWWDANLIERQDPERLQGYTVSSTFFEAVGIQPQIGRGFVRDDETPGRRRVVIVGDGLWKRKFAGDPGLVGRSITIDGDVYEVIGIAPPRFDFPQGSELWSTQQIDAAKAPRDARYLTVIGRLTPGETLQRAQAEMTVTATRLAQQYPDANKDHGIRVYTFVDGLSDGGTGSILALWQASAIFVLLIACANIANLLLARAAERRRETAVRVALGAGRARVVRELLIESALLGLLATPLALGIAWLSVHAMQISMPARIMRFVPGWHDLGLNPRLLGFTLLLALATAVAFGLLPALQAARPRVAESLKEGGRTSTGGRHGLRRALVIAEMALTLPLLVAAALGVLGTNRLLYGPQGYDPNGLLMMKLLLPDRTYSSDAARRQYVTRSLDAFATIAGVEQAAVVNDIPTGGANWTRRIEIEGHPPVDPKVAVTVDWREISPDYFPTMRIPVRAGRGFTRADREDTARVAVVSESMARKFWPGEDPLGRKVRAKDGTWLTVVGVCGDVIHDWFDRRNAPTLYVPFEQEPNGELAFVVRTTGDPATASGPVRQALLTIDPKQPVFDLMTMRTALKERTIGLQYLSAVMTVFAGLALVLAIVGLYAVMAYMVAQRTHEIGVRIALGAAPTDVMRLTVGQAARLTAIGATIGLVLSVALSRLLEAALLGIASSDARVSLLFVGILVASALLAGYLPARRAANIDPIVALRSN